LHNTGTTAPDGTGYNYWQQVGSSLAAPHVAGIASLALAMDPNLSPAEVQWLIESNARGFPAVSTDACSPSTCGAGLADAAATVAFLAPNGTTPAPPPPSGRKTPPAPPAPMPSPEGQIPPATRVPVAGGWDAKSGAELDAIRK
jgi:serine protease